MTKRTRYITHIGYFGRTSNLRLPSLPIAVDQAAAVIAQLPDRTERRRRTDQERAD